MIHEETKYGRILNILRKSKPVLRSSDEIEEMVMNRIMKKQEKAEPSSGILDILFGWVYIGWIRTGLVTTSILLVTAFIYQQALILKRINKLDRQDLFIENRLVTGPVNGIDDRLLLYKLSGRKFQPGQITISEKQIKHLIDSFNELQSKYKDIIKLIEEDPVLKDYIEKKLAGKNNRKLKI